MQNQTGSGRRSRFHFSFFGRLLLICAIAVCFLTSVQIGHAQTAVSEPIVITGEEVPSAYGAPPGISRTRFSPLVTAYVLPPGAIYSGITYEGDVFRHGPPDHLFTEEVELGLPHRLGVAFELSQERFDGDFQNKSFSVELRYALADWNKVPLNPTLFAEYKFWHRSHLA